MAQVQIVTKRNELRRLLRRLDARQSRGREDIALRDLAVGNQRQRLRAQRDPSGRDRLPRANRLGRNIDHLRAAIGRDVRKAIHLSAADRHHLPPRLISGAEVVLFRLSLHHIEEEALQLRIARPRAHHLHNVELEVTPETRP